MSSTRPRRIECKEIHRFVGRGRPEGVRPRLERASRATAASCSSFARPADFFCGGVRLDARGDLPLGLGEPLELRQRAAEELAPAGQGNRPAPAAAGARGAGV